MSPREELNYVAHALYVRHLCAPQNWQQLVCGEKICRDKSVMVAQLEKDVMILVWYFRYFELLTSWPEPEVFSTIWWPSENRIPDEHTKKVFLDLDVAILVTAG